MPTAISSAEDRAITIIAPQKFHQIFTIPATDKHGPLKVTYAVLGKQDGDDVPTIMFCGGMFGMRWQGIYFDWLAEQEDVRMLVVDRPGFGGSTPAPINQRIAIFLEIVPPLLSHLNIKQISIASHSAGTLYGLNLLCHRPDLLSPNLPSITLFSPWVHQSHTDVPFLVAASMLPNTLLNHWSDLTGFIVNNASPVFAASGGASSYLLSMFKSNVKEEKAKALERCKEGFGFGTEVKKAMDRLIFKYAWAEDSTGGNDEARLCLKSVVGSDWGACDDYPKMVQNLKEVWEKRVEEKNGEGKLMVRIVFAGEDVMIGVKGKKYFEDCWTEEKCGKGIDVKCVQPQGTDHDSVVDPSKGVMREIFRALRESSASFAD